MGDEPRVDIVEAPWDIVATRLWELNSPWQENFLSWLATLDGDWPASVDRESVAAWLRAHPGLCRIVAKALVTWTKDESIRPAGWLVTYWEAEMRAESKTNLWKMR